MISHICVRYASGAVATAKDWTTRAHVSVLSGELIARIAGGKTAAPMLMVDGPCPRCHAILGVRRTEATVVIRGGTQQTVPRVVACDCSEPHPGRPDGVKGCGAQFTVTALVE